jgi:serine/threonine-protein kinase HipA
LHDGPGWRLAPAYDLNPVPVDVRPRIHALCLDEDDTRASIDTVMAVAPRFGVVRRDALSIAREVAVSVRSWRKVGARHGIRPREIDRMASAFEHDDLQAVPR